MITVNGNSEFDTQIQNVELVPGQARYNIFIKTEPKGRVVHIRVRGRSENGSLVPVRALIYDRSGQRIAITDDNGFVTLTSFWVKNKPQDRN